MHVAICDDDEMSRFLILKLLSEYTSAHQDKSLSFSAFSILRIYWKQQKR